MIVVKIELHSAITRKITEIGRMYIANDGAGTPTRGDYRVAVCRRNSDEVPAELLDYPRPRMPKAARFGVVRDYPRLSYNVWRLIARATLAAFPEEKIAKANKIP
jgi:hypothetical protein